MTGVRAGVAHWVLLGGIIATATLLRVVAIDTQGLWTDEALTIALSNWSIGDMFLKPTDPTPFLYYALHKLLLAPDASVVAMRSISLVIGVLSVGLIYVLGRLAFGPWGGLLAAALLAVWNRHVDYSQEARAYSLLFFLTLLTSVGFLLYAEAVRERRADEPAKGYGHGKAALVLFGLGNVLSFYTHVVSVYWIALTSMLLLAVVVRQEHKRQIEVGVLFAIMALCALPGVYRLLQQMGIDHNFDWMKHRTLSSFLRVCLDVFLPQGFWENPLTRAFGLTWLAKALTVGAYMMALAFVLWLGRKRIPAFTRERPQVIWLVIAYLLVPLLMWLQGFVGPPILIGRVILYAMPGLILLITGLCLALDRRAAVRAGTVAFCAYAISLLLTGTIREREDWRGAYKFLAIAVAPGDLIAICPAFNYPALRYYASAPVPAPVVTVTDDKLAEIEQALGSDASWDRTYFRTLMYPQLMAELESEMGRPDNSGAAKAIELKPGQSIWRVDGHCGRSSDEMDRALSAVGRDPGAVRFLNGTRRSGIISIRQYQLTAPVALEVRSLVPLQSLESN